MMAKTWFYIDYPAVVRRGKYSSCNAQTGTYVDFVFEIENGKEPESDESLYRLHGSVGRTLML
jgi:hypothetical protein